MTQRSLRMMGLWMALLLASTGWASGALAQECNGFIGDFVFHDVNGNGLQDGPDLGLAGAVARLTDADGNSSEVVSQEIAGYGFYGLCAGEYTLEIVSVPPGYSLTTPDVGSDDTVDSDPNPSTVVLATDDSVDDTVDFGFVFEEPGCGLALDATTFRDTISLSDRWCGSDYALAIYRYAVSNDGADPIYWTYLNDDHLGFVGFVWQLFPGETKVRYWLACLSKSTSSVVTATGWSNGEKCSASDAVGVTVVP